MSFKCVLRINKLACTVHYTVRVQGTQTDGRLRHVPMSNSTMFKATKKKRHRKTKHCGLKAVVGLSGYSLTCVNVTRFVGTLTKCSPWTQGVHPPLFLLRTYCQHLLWIILFSQHNCIFGNWNVTASSKKIYIYILLEPFPPLLLPSSLGGRQWVTVQVKWVPPLLWKVQIKVEYTHYLLVNILVWFWEMKLPRNHQNTQLVFGRNFLRKCPPCLPGILTMLHDDKA